MTAAELTFSDDLLTAIPSVKTASCLTSQTPAVEEISTVSLIELLIKRRQKERSFNSPAELNQSLESPFSVSRLFVPAQESPVQWAFKRLLDVTATLAGLSVIIWPLLLVALAIKLESKGPVFFRQTRLGANGKRFEMVKFRSMYVDAEARLNELLEQNQTNGAMFKMEDDPRITRVGAFIRKYSIDEFPQLINVLRGEMSLVGPRPPIERELAAYEPWHYVRFSTKPGMTGEWQVSGRSEITSFDKVVALDFRYIFNWSLLRDVRILFKTIPAVLAARGAS